MYSSEKKVMYSITLMARMPFYIANAVAFFWILKSLNKTIMILKKTKQAFKLKLFNNFYYAVLIIFAILIFAGVLQLLILIFRELGTEYVNLVSQELLPTVFSLVIFSIMLTMRPTTKSKLLVHHEELQEEHTEHSVDHGYGPHRASVIPNDGLHHHRYIDEEAKSPKFKKAQHKGKAASLTSDLKVVKKQVAKNDENGDDHTDSGDDDHHEYAQPPSTPEKEPKHEPTEELDVDESPSSHEVINVPVKEK